MDGWEKGRNDGEMKGDYPWKQLITGWVFIGVSWEKEWLTPFGTGCIWEALRGSLQREFTDVLGFSND